MPKFHVHEFELPRIDQMRGVFPLPEILQPKRFANEMMVDHAVINYDRLQWEGLHIAGLEVFWPSRFGLKRGLMWGISLKIRNICIQNGQFHRAKGAVSGLDKRPVMLHALEDCLLFARNRILDRVARSRYEVDISIPSKLSRSWGAWTHSLTL